MKRKSISLMLIVILILQILLPMLTIISESDFTNKSLASNDNEITWDASINQDGSISVVYNNETKTLTISGSGKMKNYGGSSSDVPWWIYYNEVKSINISEGIKSICDYAFYEYKNITSVILPDSISYIGYKAFFGCSNLREIQLGSGLIEIYRSAFEGCRSLNNIQLPDKITTISGGAFKDCISLINILIPNSVEIIGEGDANISGTQFSYQFDVFRGCINLESIFVGENNQNYSSIDGVLFNKDKTKLISYPEGKKTEEYIIPSTVTKVGAFSFFNAKNLSTLILQEGITKIEGGAFSRCNNLKNINIPKTVEFLEGEDTESINDIFACKKLQNINVDEDNTNYSSVDGVLFDKNKTKIIFYPNGKNNKEYVIPDSVNAICGGAFAENKYLENIEIPNSVTRIEWFAFYGCSSLESIKIPDSVKKMGSIVFETYMGIIFEGCTSLVSVELPSHIDEFYASRMFRGCEKLTTVNLPTNITYIPHSMFEGCKSLKSIYIPNGVTAINDCAFQECSSLETININNKVTNIGKCAFLGTNLKEIKICEGVKVFGGAFSSARNVNSIIISEDVTSISTGAFKGTVLKVDVAVDSNQNYEIELPDIIKRAQNEEDMLYSSSGFYLSNCSWNEDNTKIIVDKTALESGTAKLMVRSGILCDLEVKFISDQYEDLIQPEVTNILAVSDGNKVYRLGEQIEIDVRFSEHVKGKAPVLKLKFGDGIERVAEPNSETGSTLRYSYTIQDGDNGELQFLSCSSAETTDWSGNTLIEPSDLTNKGNKIFASTNIAKEGEICAEYHITNKEELLNIQHLINSRYF